MKNIGGRAKIYKRATVDGIEYLVINNSTLLKDVDLSWVRNDEDIKQILSMLHEYVDIAAKWFWIETDVPVKLVRKSDGFTWLVPDERQNSGNFKWLRTKAERCEEKIVTRINQYGEGIKQFLMGAVHDMATKELFIEGDGDVTSPGQST